MRTPHEKLYQTRKRKRKRNHSSKMKSFHIFPSHPLLRNIRVNLTAPQIRHIEPPTRQNHVELLRWFPLTLIALNKGNQSQTQMNQVRMMSTNSSSSKTRKKEHQVKCKRKIIHLMKEPRHVLLSKEYQKKSEGRRWWYWRNHLENWKWTN